MKRQIRAWKRVFILSVGMFWLAGCAGLSTWSELSKREYKDRARRFEAEVPLGWMRYNLLSYFVMTKDGTVLNRIAVERYPFDKKLEFTEKKFTADMTPLEIAELEIDNLKSNQNSGQFKLLQNKPATIDNLPAFGIEYTYRTIGGLRVHGCHYGFLKDKWVYRILYEAPEQHYFKKYKADFERFIDSFKLI